MTEAELLTEALREERAAVCQAAGVRPDDLLVIEDAAVAGADPAVLAGRAKGSRSAAWGAMGRVRAAAKRVSVDDIRRLVWIRRKGASR